MTATNWAECPRCELIRQKRSEERQAVLANAYGKVSLKKWTALKEAAHCDDEADQQDSLETLGEYYEIGVDSDGVYRSRYTASCDQCGFRFTASHELPTDALKEPLP